MPENRLRAYSPVSHDSIEDESNRRKVRIGFEGKQLYTYIYLLNVC